MGGEGKRHETPHLRKQLRFTSHLGAYRTFKPLFLPAATNFKSVVSGLFEQGAQVASGETAMFCRTRGTLRWFCFGKKSDAFVLGSRGSGIWLAKTLR